MLLVRRMRGLGDGESLTPETIRAMMTATSQFSHGRFMLTQPASAPPPMTTTTATLTAGSPDEICRCAVERVAARFTMTSDVRAAALSQCMGDPGVFQQNAMNMGVTDLACDSAQPWYKKPAVWILGGAGVLVGALVLKAAL